MRAGNGVGLRIPVVVSYRGRTVWSVALDGLGVRVWMWAAENRGARNPAVGRRRWRELNADGIWDMILRGMYRCVRVAISLGH